MAKERKAPCFLDLLSIEEITSLYKHFSGVTQIRFKDRQDGEIRLLNVTFGKPRLVLVEAMKQAGISKDVIGQFGELMRGPINLPHGQMKPDDLKKHAAALASGKKEGGSGGSLRGKAIAVLSALRELIPVDATGEKAFVSSTEVAKKLETNTNLVTGAADQLKKQKLIEIEDDSHEEGGAFYWLSLLPAGREMVLPSFSGKLPASTPGPRTGFSGMRIYKLVAKNPRREGTHGYNSFNLVTDGMTFDEYKSKGGRNIDLAWDIDKKFVELRKDGEAPPAPAKLVEPEAAKPNSKGKVKRATGPRKGSKKEKAKRLKRIVRKASAGGK
jgi:hypothetical protein